MAQPSKTEPVVVALTEEQRQSAMERFAVLRPHLEEDVPLAQAARHAGVAVRTAERWLSRYRRMGLVGLARPVRSDADGRRLPADLVAFIEGMGLKKPRASVAAIHRRISSAANAQKWPVPSYSTVYAIIANLDPAMVTLAHEGASAFRNRYELIHRHRAETANAVWQADHTVLDVLILDHTGKPARPWLTTVVDDYSRAVAGVMVFFGAPSILNTSLALRQAIWRKGDPAWPVCGVPDVLYVDYGCDFTSKHLDQVAASLKFRIVYSAVARPQGRGKIERLWERPELHRLLDQLRKGDVLVVWKLDRLSRSLRDVLTIMERLGEAEAGFQSLTEAIDTTTPAGRMMMQMVGAFAEFERAMLRERTKAGLDSARREGRIGGRRPKLTPQQQSEIRKMVSKGRKTASDAARLFKVHPATVSRLLARAYAK